MTEDFIEAAFSGLDQFYPGSKRKRKAHEPKKQEVEPGQGWDSRPYVKTLPNGKDVEMFTIGALAEALGRPVITIRTWIKEGHIPASPYRLPAKQNVRGETQMGRRLYSRSMVEKLIELFEKSGLLYIKRIEWTEHRKLSNEIAEAWEIIRATETN
jgi:hypothetical protein